VSPAAASVTTEALAISWAHMTTEQLNTGERQ